MKFFSVTAILALAATSASAFTPSSFTPRSPLRVGSSSTLQMVADDAKVILVTGASRGLGRAIAVELGKQGQKVIVNYAGSEAAAHETVDMIKAAGGDAVAIQANCKWQHSSLITYLLYHLDQVFRSDPFNHNIIISSDTFIYFYKQQQVPILMKSKPCLINL